MRFSRALQLTLAAAGLAFFASVPACDDKTESSAAPTPTTPAPTCSAPTTSTKAALRTEPIEWVAYHTEVPIPSGEIRPLIDGLVGAGAQGGAFAPERELTPSLFLTAQAEPATPDQLRLLVAFKDATMDRRPIALTPGSFKIGQIWQMVVDAAVTKMDADEAAKPGSGESFLLEYRTTSSNGGRLSLGIRGVTGAYSLVVDVSTPRTSLQLDRLGKAAEQTDPFDTVAGTVDFHMSRDDFDYFVDHAYGKGATSRQNFTDFALVPHEWLRLTVKPQLDKKFVEVGFELLTPGGQRLAVAKAPASVLAGAVFQGLVLQNMKTMTEQEKKQPGSSTPWTAPFYYDAPADGGVVQVIAQGVKGQFSVAYSVETPRHTLQDVSFLDYQPVEIPAPDPNETASCEQLGDPTIQLAPRGTLDITFRASQTVLKSDQLKGPLVGTIYCGIYRAADVKITGPIKDAQSVQDFQVDNADLSEGAAPVTFVSDELFAGDYQVLCAQDLDASGGASKGDPVTLPIGGFPVACNRNPTIVEFALLNPQD